MDRQAKLDLLNRVLDGTVNSVVQYIEAAAPYVPPACEEKMADLARLREEEADLAHRLVDAIAELDGVPQVGVFPYWNVDLNYLDVRFLCGFAARHEDLVIAELEEFVESARADGRLRALCLEVLELKRAHRDALRAVAAIETPAPSDELREKAKPQEAQHVPRPK